SQIQTFLKVLKSETVQNITSLDELFAWCRDNERTPDDPNVMFCPMHQIDRDRGIITALRIFLTTMKLLSLVEEDVEMLATDSTYKLVWNGYKVLLVGSCDREKKFHPFGIAVTMCEKNQDFEFLFYALKETVKKLFERHIQPTVLLADGAEAIHNGFAKVFTLEKRIMCWAHVKRNVHTRFCRNKHYYHIKNDIDSLQLSITESMFESASKLFIKKWTELDKDFSSYFETTWINSSVNGWFDGRSQSHPITNNALESHNKIIKDLVERKSMPLADFLKNINDAVLQFWSFQRNDIRPDQKVFSKEPNVSLDDFKRGFAWEILGLKVLKQKFGGKTFFFVQRTPKATQASTSTQATTSTQASTSTQATTSTQASTSTQATTSTQPEKRKRGRPPKKNVKEVENKLHEVDTFKPIDKERCKNYIQMLNQCELTLIGRVHFIKELFSFFEQQFK
ncbi:hypothetical protein BpHYR1_024800, partial [Brachionus plicatilis]